MKIEIKGGVAHLMEGSASIVDTVLSIADPKARFQPAYRCGAWDGIAHFFDYGKQTFPAGLVPLLQERLQQRRMELTIIDHRKRLGVEVKPDFLIGIKLRDYQVELVNTCLRKGNGTVWAATGAGKSACCAALSGMLILHDISPVIVMVPKLGLLSQTARNFEQFLGIDIGIIGGGQRKICDITIATPQTLMKAMPWKMSHCDSKGRKKYQTMKPEPELEKLLSTSKAIILDEGHHGSSNTWFSLAMASPADYRFIFSGTPFGADELENRRVRACAGDVIYEVRAKQLMDIGVLATPTVYVILDENVYGKRIIEKPTINEDGETVRETFNSIYDRGVVTNKHLNRSIAILADRLIRAGKPPFILTPRVQHVREIHNYMTELRVPCVVLTGKSPVHVREQVIKEYEDGGQFAVLATSIMDEGIDIKIMYSLILAGSGKSEKNLLQRIGRCVRKKSGDNSSEVYDFTNLSHPFFVKQALSHIDAYDKEGFKVVEVTDFNQAGRT